MLGPNCIFDAAFAVCVCVCVRLFIQEVECVSHLQSHLIPVERSCVSALWDWRAASVSSTAGEREALCWNAERRLSVWLCAHTHTHTHIMTCVLVKRSSTQRFRFIIILLLCWRLYNSHGFEVIFFLAFAMKRTFIFIEKNLIYTLHWLLYENKNSLNIATVKLL